jgi:predicted ferric reductase
VTNELWWYVARSCGIVCWLVVSASVLWGLVLSSKSARKRLSAAWVLDLHRHLGGLGVVFLALHLLGLAEDRFIRFSLVELLVPLASHWRAGAVAWGVTALYLLVAVEVTSLLRRRLPSPVWRATHMLSFPVFVMASVHLLTAGTDAHVALLRWPALALLGLVPVATAARVVTARRVRARRRAAAEAMASRHPIGSAERRFRLDRSKSDTREAVRTPVG